MTERCGRETKHSKQHPHVRIEHRVIDSAAFARLAPSSVLLLVILVRQLTKDNNGHLQASFGYCSRFGLRSEDTLRRSIADLITHGFIYRTRSHGANKVYAKYAVTWLTIKQKDGLFLNGFEMFAWRKYDE